MRVFGQFLIGNVRFHSNEDVNSKQPPPPPTDSESKNRPISPRMEEFQKKLRAKTPIGKLGSLHLSSTLIFTMNLTR